MKKIYLFFAVLITAMFSANAQTDVTSLYISNSTFDSGFDYAFATTGNLATGAGSKKALSGWTAATATNSCAGAFEYGTLATFNNGTIPGSGFGGSTGGCFAFSNGWGETVLYTTTNEVTLPVGTYKFIYAANNRIASPMASSRFGFVPTTGTAKYTSRVAASYFALNTWVADTVTFTVATPTPGKFSMGYVAVAGSGSGASAKLCVDFVKVVLMPVDKTNLQTLITSANTMYNGTHQPVGASTAYADLNTAITAAQAVYDNAGATAAEVIGQETALSAAIAAVNSAIAIQARVAAWTTLPYDATSVIVNPSFEVNGATGWTNVGPFVSQNNTSFPYKAGNIYFEKWKGSGNWTGLKISQKIADLPNGVYSLTAGALNEPNTTGGAFVFANAEKVEVFTSKDYTIIVTVTNHELEIGYEVINGGNYVAVDNFRLSYVSDGSPYVVLAPATLFFDPNNLTRTINVTGGNLSTNLTLSAPTGITLDKSVLTPAEVAAGAVVTATFDNATAITNGSISAISGSLTQSVTINASADLSCFTPLYSSLTNLIPNVYMNDISAFGGWGHKSVVLGEAYCGAACVKFDAVTNGYPDGAALDVANIPWAANSTYRLHVWVKAVDGTFAFFAKGTSPDVTISVPMSGNNWVEIDTLFTTGATPSNNFFSFNNVDGASTGKIAYLDNYELYDVTSIVTGTSTPKDNAFNAFVRDNKVVVRTNLAAETQAQINVYNVNGMLIASEKISGTNEKTLNTNLVGGVYFVQMQSEGKLITQKIIK